MHFDRVVHRLLRSIGAGLGVGLVAGVARLVVPPGVKCLALTDTPAGFRVGIALARRAGETSRLVERFTEHAMGFSTVPRRAQDMGQNRL